MKIESNISTLLRFELAPVLQPLFIESESANKKEDSMKKSMTLASIILLTLQVGCNITPEKQNGNGKGNGSSGDGSASGSEKKSCPYARNSEPTSNPSPGPNPSPSQRVFQVTIHFGHE